MKNYPSSFLEINGKIIANECPTYFIADIAANHDGDLRRAKDLIYMASDAGADAAKFQHFTASTIVSDAGFKKLGNNLAHQVNWEKTVFEVYRDASLKLDWTEALREACEMVGIAFFTSPYSIEIVDYIDSYVPAYKIGSGDITWIEIVRHIASKQKPYMIATGASTMDDVNRAVSVALEINPMLCLMQCNTNYTANLDNFQYINLNVLKTYRDMYPNLILGLSDHTPGLTTVLGAVALGAKVIEKHFTDDVNRKGPDHKFSMDPAAWREMVVRTRELENALGCGIKKIEDNEKESAIVQRRSICAKIELIPGSILTNENLVVLRPCPNDGLPPYFISNILGKKIRKHVMAGEHLKWDHIE